MTTLHGPRRSLTLWASCIHQGAPRVGAATTCRVLGSGRGRHEPRATASAVAVALVLGSLAAATSAAAQTDADRAEAAARGFDGALTAGHFAVFWRLREGSADDVRRFLATAEPVFERISAVVGPERTPTEPVVLVLAGHGRAADGMWRAPTVDDRGRVILLRYADGIESYRQELAHELVHAFRRHAGRWLSGFVEEGFAEAIAMEVDPGEVGFPRYGHPLAVIAGDLLARDEYLPLAAVRARHEELNRRCQLQAYLERASFFDYLKRTAGLDALLALVDRPVEPEDVDYEALFGGPFSGLVASWRTWLLAEYQSLPDAEEAARRYRAEPAIEGRPICRPDDAAPPA